MYPRFSKLKECSQQTMSSMAAWVIGASGRSAKVSVVCVFFTCVFERGVCVCVWLFESTHLVPMLLAQVHNTTVVVCRRYTGKICPQRATLKGSKELGRGGKLVRRWIHCAYFIVGKGPKNPWLNTQIPWFVVVVSVCCLFVDLLVFFVSFYFLCVFLFS